MSKFRRYDISVFAVLENIKLMYFIVNMCQYVVCANGGICRQANTAQCFTCECQVGFTGPMCETRENSVNIGR